MQGNAGGDTMHGGADDDDMIGGTGLINDDPEEGVAGRLDAETDTMNGDDGFDVMAGDNAVIVRELDDDGAWVPNAYDGGVRHETRILLDIDSPDADIVSGPDIMEGNADNDLMYGQGGNDTMRGGGGDDFMEGNAAADTMHGGPDQDDMIGGTVQEAVTDDDDPETGSGDTMFGDGKGDVLLGDNGRITRCPPGENCTWTTDVNTGDVIREVVLFDVETVGAEVSPAFSGGDTMHGGAGHDLMFGQGGTDTMQGGGGFDVMEGNHDDDTMWGDDADDATVRNDAGEDDMIGGGSSNTGIISPESVGDGLLDGEDEMHGGGEGDVMTGDNARIRRLVDASDIWILDPNVTDVVREVVLFDIETTGDAPVDPSVKGSDRMFGDDGRDLMFGQGNTDADADGDDRFNEDPGDGLDNDRDGRESPSSIGFDCEDGFDNDGDGLWDAVDPECQASLDEDGNGDEMHGGRGVDYMEGNHGSDWMFGDGDEDDIIGGSSSGEDGRVGTGQPPTGLLDGDDVISGGADDDVILGDNGLIERPVDGSGLWLRHTGAGFDLAIRNATVTRVPAPTGSFGHDYLKGNTGNEEMHGQQGNDYMEGNEGEDALAGDLALITSNIEDGSRERVITSPGPFFQETIFVEGTFYRLFELFSFLDGDGAEGHDTLLGGDGRDSLHGGPGDDVINGDGDSPRGMDPLPATNDADKVFGGDGNDVAWGGRDDDDIWGGHGDDHLDVRPRREGETPTDPPEWFTYGEPDNYQGLDIVYGGWDRDAMQANVAAPGPQDTDRLIDWAGGYNVFYVCPGAYGEGTITRQGNPALRVFLEDLAAGDGALMPADEGTSGFRELGYVFPNERRFNSHPPHPDHPGNFTCDEGTVSPPRIEQPNKKLKEEPGTKVQSDPPKTGGTEE
jgi:Ca2+-binding RTX toxin-like protein